MTRPPQRPLSNISLFDLHRRIGKLRGADLKNLSSEAAAHRIGQVIDQYPFQIRSLQLSGLYRSRPNRPGEIFSSASELWYPPADKVTRPSRLNGPSKVRFYGANMPNTALLELRPQPGNIFTVLIARTRSGAVETLNTSFVGLERSLAPEVQHLGDGDTFHRASHFREHLGAINYKKWLLIDDYLSEIFGESVAEGEDYKYKPTIALADILFTAPKLDAVTYPSVATSDHGINICMAPEKVDEFFLPFEAWMIRVEEQALHPETRQLLHRVHFLNRSQEIAADGAIIWRPVGDGINSNEIMRFVRRRMGSLNQWPLPADSS